MTVLTTIPNGASYKDIRDTLNSVLRRLLSLEAGSGVPPTLNAVLVMEGDSIGYGYQGGGHVAVAQLGYPSAVSVTNASVSAKTLADILADAEAGSGAGAVPASLYDPARTCIVIIQRGTNDFTVNGTDGAETYQITKQLVARYKTLGFYVVLETVLPRTYDWNSTREGYRTRYNVLVRANTAGADAVVDGAADEVIGDNADFEAMLADGLHLNAAGQDRKTVLYRATLDLLLARAPRAQTPLPPLGIRFETRNGMTEAPSTAGLGYDYTPTAAGASARSGQRLAAGADGWIGYTLTGPVANGTVIEFVAEDVTDLVPNNARIALHANTAYNGGYYHVWYNAGSIITSTVAPAAGDRLRVRRAGNMLYAECYRDGAWSGLFSFDAGGSPALVPALYSQDAGAERRLNNTVAVGLS